MSLQKFNFENNNIRVLNKEGNPWFIAKDICNVLGLSNVSQSLSILDEDERSIISNDAIEEQSFTKYTVLIVNESGFYNLVLSSRKPEAKVFKKWVTSIVLPEIRKNGSFSTTPYQVPTTYAQALRELANNLEKSESMQKQLEEQRPAVEFFEAVSSSEDTMDMAAVAKLLGTGRNRLFAFLRDDKILIKDADSLPYQQYIDAGYFKVIEQKFNKPDGKVHINKKVLVYQKGIDFIRKRLKKFENKDKFLEEVDEVIVDLLECEGEKNNPNQLRFFRKVKIQLKKATA